MPKRVGYLYDKMVDRDFIRSVIQEAAKGRRNRRDIARVLADLDGIRRKDLRACCNGELCAIRAESA